MKAAIENLDEEDADAIKDYFNDFIEDEDDLGDILFDSATNFEERLKFFNDATVSKYTDEL